MTPSAAPRASTTSAHAIPSTASTPLQTAIVNRADERRTTYRKVVQHQANLSGQQAFTRARSPTSPITRQRLPTLRSSNERTGPGSMPSNHTLAWPPSRSHVVRADLAVRVQIPVAARPARAAQAAEASRPRRTCRPVPSRPSRSPARTPPRPSRRPSRPRSRARAGASRRSCRRRRARRAPPRHRRPRRPARAGRASHASPRLRTSRRIVTRHPWRLRRAGRRRT